MRTDVMITLFKEMVNTGQYNVEDPLERGCCQYCFGNLIQSILDQCKQEWNTHYIRKSAFSESFGRPDIIYSFPPENFDDKAVPVNEEDIRTVCSNLPASQFEEENIYEDYFHYLSECLQLEEPSTLVIAKHNFLLLMQHAK